MPTSAVERRLAAIVAADIAGYTRLMEADERATLSALKAHRQALIDPLIADHKGHIVKTMGDGLLLEFPSVVEAVACAVAVQRGMVERNREVPVDRRIEFRVGVNIGDVIVEEGDVFGDGVNVAARLQQLAEPGGICVSEDAYRQVRGKLEVSASDAGEQHLKNVSRPVRIYRIDPAGQRARPMRLGALRKRRVMPALAGASLVAAALAAAGVWVTADRRAERAEPAQGTAGQQARETYPVIAVLPFANQTGDPGQEYFADGVTDEVINALGRFNTLRVIGRNAVLPYKGRPATQAEIVSELGADYLVEGSVRRAERRVRIAVQLSDARASTVLWTDRHDGELSDVLDFQEAIARRVAGTVAANITHREGRRSLDQARPNEDAHDLVLRARATGFQSTRTANREVRELMAKAIELDPDYAVAQALLAEALYAQVVLGWAEFADRDLTRGEEHARRAIRLAPDEPDGHRALGRFLVLRGEYAQAQDELRRALEINPSDAYALAVQGAVQSFTGNLDGAIESLELALRYDPALEPVHVFDLSICYYLARRHADALRIAERGLASHPDFAVFNLTAAASAAQLGRHEQAARYAQEVRRRLPFLDLDAFGSRFKDPSHPAYLLEGLRSAGL